MGETIPETELEPSGKLPVYSATESGKILGFSNLRKPLVFKGDLIIPARGNSIGAVKLVVRPSSCTQTTIAAKLIDHKGIIPKYAFYFARAFRNDLFYFDNTAIPQITTEYVSQNPLLIPPSIEQQKIAQFLDYETAKIGALIDEQKRLIELLKEKRQAVISHAVTKGLSPDAPMKDSGFGWLGEVPEHWSIVYSKHLFDFVTSGSRGWADYYSDEGSLFFRIANLTRDTIEPKLESVQKVTPPPGSEGERSKIKINDILFSITADLGSVCVADESVADGYVSQHVALARPSAKVNSSRWLAYALISDSSKAQILGSGYGGTKIQLSLNDVKDVVLVEPSKAEQMEIADYLDSSLAKMNNLLEQAESLISLLTERRTALISAAVTGKIDVRDWQPPAGSDTVDSNASVQTERHYG